MHVDAGDYPQVIGTGLIQAEDIDRFVRPIADVCVSPTGMKSDISCIDRRSTETADRFDHLVFIG
jgi:hypothetical protein